MAGCSSDEGGKELVFVLIGQAETSIPSKGGTEWMAACPPPHDANARRRMQATHRCHCCGEVTASGERWNVASQLSSVRQAHRQLPECIGRNPGS